MTNNSQNVDGEIACSPDGSHVFYRGEDLYIHQQYYIGSGNWGHDWMTCYNYLNNNMKANYNISCSNDKVYYEGSDYKLHIWEYDSDCTPQPLPFISKINDPSESISNIKNKNIQLYPNPFSNEFNIAGLALGDIILTYDIMGNLFMKKLVINKDIIKINTYSWQNGIYLLKILNNKNELKETLKIVK